MSLHSEEDYAEMEKKNAALADEIKTTQAAMADLEKKDEGKVDKTKDLQAKLQANEDKIKDQEEKMQAMEKKDKTRDEVEKHEIATKLANYDVQSEKINDSEVDAKIKELKKRDTNVLQAMLPYAEGEAKEHKENKEAKQASLRGGTEPRYTMSEQELETHNKQAAGSKNFMADYRSGFY